MMSTYVHTHARTHTRARAHVYNEVELQVNEVSCNIVLAMFCRFDSQGSTGLTEALFPISLDANEEDSPVTNGDTEPLIILCTEHSRVPVEQPLEIDRLHRSSIAGAETMVIAVLNGNSNHSFFLNRSGKWKIYDSYRVSQGCLIG